jgi:hypothetical protein
MNTRKIFIACIMLMGITMANLAAKTIQVTFNYKFSNIVEGYDHNSRLKVYLDGALIGTSGNHLESKPNSFTVQFESGYHQLRAVVETEYEGVWEEHTIANTYSIDCLYDNAMTFAKPKTIIKIDFDIDLGAIINGKFNGVKVKKKK